MRSGHDLDHHGEHLLPACCPEACAARRQKPAAAQSDKLTTVVMLTTVVKVATVKNGGKPRALMGLHRSADGHRRANIAGELLVRRYVEVLARIIERAAMLRYLRSFGVGGANQFCFLSFAICGFCTALNATCDLN